MKYWLNSQAAYLFCWFTGLPENGSSQVKGISSEEFVPPLWSLQTWYSSPLEGIPDETKVRKMKCFVTSDDGRHNPIELPDGEVVTLGRSPLTGITDSKVSRQHSELYMFVKSAERRALCLEGVDNK